MKVKDSRRTWLRVPEMEGRAAHWYARQRGSGDAPATYRTRAAGLTAHLPAGADVLEVAPGPGYLAVEIARRGFHVAGLDISRTMVEIASEHARREGVAVDVRRGDASAMPFADGSFDLIVCEAAFKNFIHPVRALLEMHRVLRAGGTAAIEDLNREASGADIASEVAHMGQSALNALSTRLTLTWLRRRAYSPDGFRRLVARTPFATCDVEASGIGLAVRMRRAG